MVSKPPVLTAAQLMARPKVGKLNATLSAEDLASPKLKAAEQSLAALASAAQASGQSVSQLSAAFAQMGAALDAALFASLAAPLNSAVTLLTPAEVNLARKGYGLPPMMMSSKVADAPAVEPGARMIDLEDDDA